MTSLLFGTVRTAGKAGDASAILTACDTLRDSTLPRVGVRLEDSTTAGGASIWKLMSPDDVAAFEKAAAEAESAKAAKEARRLEALRKDAEAVCVVSCRVVSCRVVSCRVVSCRVVSCRVVSCRVVSCRVVSCRVVSCRVVSCRVVSSGLNSSVFPCAFVFLGMIWASQAFLRLSVMFLIGCVQRAESSCAHSS